jgi:hypothetical protein
MYNFPSMVEPCTFYIFQDHTAPRFKVGISKNLENRLKSEIWRVLGGRSLDKMTVYRKWNMLSGFAACLVECEAKSILETVGFRRVLSRDWFEVDEATMVVFADLIDDFTKAIWRWQICNSNRTCSAIGPGTPYGDFVKESGRAMWIQGILKYENRPELD